MLSRRTFLSASAGLMATPGVSTGLWAAAGRAPRLLLRSSWQVVNIGDIAHTPGVLALLEKHFPEAEVKLWASPDLTSEVAAMEHRRFPNLEIVKGTLNAQGKASTPELQQAVEWSDFFLHGSGPSLVAEKDLAAYVRVTGKPFGVYGITFSGGTEAQRTLMSQARFLYFRDTVSLAKAKSTGVTCPIMEFGPDGAFACDLRNDPPADEFLQQNGLVAGKFLCCIPRLRYTPYWLIRKERPFHPERDRRNEEMIEHDHAPLREAIMAVTRETDCRILLCPEDMTQMQVGRRAIFDRLPDDVKKKVVWKESFWLTDEALSTYRRSAGLFGLEMHSPIMAIGNGIPALVGRFEEQTSKGFMWRDIGLGNWLFDMDRPEEVAQLTPSVLGLIQNPMAAMEKVQAAQRFLKERQTVTMKTLRASVPG